jgi:hypothetical protein
MVAASFDGLRLTTLARTVRRWIDLAPQADAADARRLEHLVRECMNGGTTAEASLFKLFPSLMLYRLDDETPGMGGAQRRFELVDTRMVASGESGDPTDRRLLDIRLTDVRELLHESLSASADEPHPDREACEALGLNPDLTWLGMTRTQLWASINFAIGEEALRQATSQLRNLDSRDLTSPYVHRRMVQTIYHGLVSYAQANQELGTNHPHVEPEQEPSLLARDPAKRFRMLYTFFLRDCIESAPDWTLGRGLARSELRFQLLRLFIAPGLNGPRSAFRIGSHEECRNLQREIHIRRDINERDPIIYLDLIEALGRAAYDTSRHAIVDMLAREAERIQDTSPLRPASPPVAELERPDAQSVQVLALRNELSQIRTSVERLQSYGDLAFGASQAKPPTMSLNRLDFLKLKIDSLQSRRELEEANRLSLQWLKQYVPVLPDLNCLGKQFVFPSPGEVSKSNHKIDFENALRKHVNDVLSKCCSDSRTTEAIADMLSRVGEIFATQADSRPNWHEASVEFLNAYAVYWIADRIRSGAGEYGDTLRWPKVSARPMRYYIRVSLKVARVLANGAQPQSQAWLCALDFFAHARDRLDVYSRHLFRSPRERLAMLLLLAACARVWHEIGGGPQPTKSGTVAEDVQPHEGLQASFGYIARAEALAVELGLPLILCYRILFERIKTARRLIEAHSPDKEVLSELLRRDLDVLDRLAHSNQFWRDLVDRQRALQTRPPEQGSAFSTEMVQRLLGTSVQD